MRIDVQQRKALVDFFRATLKHNEAAIAARRGSTPKNPADRALFEQENDMVAVARAAVEAFDTGR